MMGVIEFLPETGRGTNCKLVEGAPCQAEGPLRQHFVLPPPLSGEDFS